MDEMKLKLSSRFMRNMISKLLTKMIYKKLGYKVELCLNDLDINVINGETSIKTNVELKLDSKEFMKIMNSIGSDD